MNITTDLIKSEQKGDRLKIAVIGEIDHHSAKVIKKRIDSELFITRPKAIFLDMSNVDFMDSSGLGLILGRYKTATELGCEFYVCDPTPAVSKIIKLAGCEKIINVIRKKEN